MARFLTPRRRENSDCLHNQEHRQDQQLRFDWMPVARVGKNK